MGGIDGLTARVLASAFRVSNTLGSGFLEKVYENALAIELRESGMNVLQQVGLEVAYKGKIVGQYVSDLIIDGTLVVEVKAVSSLQPMHEAQCINYLRAGGLKICLLLNFGHSKVQYRRLVWGL